MMRVIQTMKLVMVKCGYLLAPTTLDDLSSSSWYCRAFYIIILAFLIRLSNKYLILISQGFTQHAFIYGKPPLSSTLWYDLKLKKKNYHSLKIGERFLQFAVEPDEVMRGRRHNFMGRRKGGTASLLKTNADR